MNHHPLLKYVTGDATQPQGSGPKIIAHICNDQNRWGAGFVLALSARWPNTKAKYHEWFATGNPKLGDVQLVTVEPDIVVANMIGQRGVGFTHGVPPIRYQALWAALDYIAAVANERKASVHAPRIGAGLAGGKWHLIEAILMSALCDEYVPVTIYDLPQIPND